MKLKQIGIIGGVGPSATILYYRQIMEGANKRLGGEHYPEILIHSLDMSEVNDFLSAGDKESLTEKLTRAVEGLHRSGCEVALISCNAMHLVFERVRRRVQIPMISILDAVMAEVKRRGLRKVGIMGTIFIMRSRLYGRLLDAEGISCVEPDPDEQLWIMEAILGDLQRAPIPRATTERLMKDVADLQDRGAEAVILACTDLPAAISEENCPVPLLDTTRIHVDTLLDFVLEQG